MSAFLVPTWAIIPTGMFVWACIEVVRYYRHENRPGKDYERGVQAGMKLSADHIERLEAVVNAARYQTDPQNWREVGVGEDGHPTWQFVGETGRLGEALAALDTAAPPESLSRSDH